MGTQPDYQSLNSLPSANLSETFLTIHVELGQIKTIASFLLAHQIPFFMSSSCFSTEVLPDTEPDKAETVADKKGTIALEEKPTCDISRNRRGIEQVFQKYIIENIEITPPNAVAIAKEAGISIFQFKSRFKKLYGNSFYQCHIEKKMEYAATLLLQGFKATEVSGKLGYAHPIKFNKMFQKYFGMTPHTYQMSRKN